MKTTLAAIAVAAALAQPASAITFSKLTTVYVAAGVEDAGTLADTATVVYCSNVSGVAANVRVLILNIGGSIALNETRTLNHGSGFGISTQNVYALGETPVGTELIGSGTLNVESTQSGVFCSAWLMDTKTHGPSGVPLHLVRINPHPGAVE
jgi:hypothetical protein